MWGRLWPGRMGTTSRPSDRGERAAPKTLNAAYASIVLAVCGGAAHAQTWRITPEIQTAATVSSNPGLVDAASARSELVLTASPRLRANRHGAGLSVDADVGFETLVYPRDHQFNQIRPRAALAWQAVAVDRWLEFDGSVQAVTSSSDPFGPLPEQSTTGNQLVTVTTHLIPRVRHEFSRGLELVAQSDRGWVRRRGTYAVTDARRNLQTTEDLVRLGQQPQALGYSFEYARQKSEYESDGSAVLDIATFRAVGLVAPSPEVQFGVTVGRETSRVSGDERKDSVRGFRLQVDPSARTRLSIDTERRFFGNGLQVQFQHRAPVVAIRARAYRQPTALPTTRVFGGVGSTSSLLDALLTTRYPDPIERARIVLDLTTRLKLPENLDGPVEVFTDTARLAEGAELSALFLGRLTTVTLAGFRTRTLPLQRTVDALALDDEQSSDQLGLSFAVSRRLTTLQSVDLLLSAERLRGLGLRVGDATVNKQLRMSWSAQLSPASTLTAGFRRRLFSSSVSTTRAASESAVFCGLGYRF